MSRIIAIMNQKDGVGKTTTAVNLGHALALAGKKVALLDMDPQNGIATSLGVKECSVGLNQILLADGKLDDYLISARGNLNIVCAGNNLADFEQLTSGGPAKGYTLKRALEKSNLISYDFVLIDCPSSSGLLGINALFAADELIIPVSGDFASLQGLSQMIHIAKRVDGMLGRTVRLWVVLTKIQLKNKWVEEIILRVLKSFPNRVFNTMIRENARLTECSHVGKTVFEYEENTIDAEDYQSLAQDLLEGRTSL